MEKTSFKPQTAGAVCSRKVDKVSQRAAENAAVTDFRGCLTKYLGADIFVQAPFISSISFYLVHSFCQKKHSMTFVHICLGSATEQKPFYC